MRARTPAVSPPPRASTVSQRIRSTGSAESDALWLDDPQPASTAPVSLTACHE